MKTLKQYLTERLIIKKSSYKYYPETKEELQEIIKQRIDQEGPEVNLNNIDTSNITDMYELFGDFNNFNGNISQWDVSNVNNMHGMFLDCELFNQNISGWDVSNVTDMRYMFSNCESFNQDISNWNVSKVKKVKYVDNIFKGCQIEEKYKPKFK